MKKLLLSVAGAAALLTLLSLTVPKEALPFFTAKDKYVKLNHYDKKNKFAGHSLFKMIERTPTGIVLNEEIYADDGDMITSATYPVAFENGVTLYGMKLMLGTNLVSIGGAELRNIEEGMMEFPANPKVGDVLKNAELTAVIFTNGDRFGALKISCTDRKVTEKGSIDTPIGTQECYCVEFTFTSKIGFVTFTNKKRFWFNPECGIVQSDRHSKRGNYTGKSELAELH